MNVPAFQPFPIEALPGPLAEYVRQAAAALACDPAYLALPILAVVASAIGATRVVRLKRGWDEPSVIWSAIIGDSGTLKSPAYLKAVSHLLRLQKRLLMEYRDLAVRHDEEMEKYKAAKKKKGGPDPGAPPVPPVLHRVVCRTSPSRRQPPSLRITPAGF